MKNSDILTFEFVNKKGEDLDKKQTQIQSQKSHDKCSAYIVDPIVTKPSVALAGVDLTPLANLTFRFILSYFSTIISYDHTI